MLLRCAPTRREFLVGAAATAAVIPFEDWFARKAAAQTATFVRRDVYTLSATGPELSAYRAGIVAMRGLPATDPRSLAFQANMHGATSGSDPAWNQCQHRNFFFFPWHRMYIYFFERIVRALSNSPDFALPYWNYFPTAQRALPLAFRSPADVNTNPLYVQQRRASVNAGNPVPESAVDHTAAFGFTNFTDGSLSFGGGRVSAPIQLGPATGRLENTPHNTIHNYVGGTGGWMSTLAMAPHDPIFWLHHANLDRLWKRWLDQGGGRANPTDEPIWMDQPFHLFDEDGDPVQMTARQILDTATQLAHVYDDDPPGDGDGDGGGNAEPATVRQFLDTEMQLGYVYDDDA